MTAVEGVTPAERATVVEGSLLLEVERAAHALMAEGREVIFLLRGEPDFATPEHIIESANAAMRAGHTHYTAAEGILPLREAVAERLLEEQGVVVDPASEVVITTGATMGLHLALQTVIEPGAEVLSLGPHYGPYGRIVKYAGGTLTSVPTTVVNGRWTMNPDLLAEKVTPATQALILNTPSNPTGAVLTEAELEAVAAIAEQHNLAILSDECYHTIVYDGHTHRSIAALSEQIRDRTVIVNSLSKSYAMTGWRLGYVTAKRSLAAPMRQMFNATGRCATSFAQHGGVAALRGPQDAVHDMATDYQRRRDIALEELKGLDVPYVVPEGTFYVFLDCTKFDMSSLELAKHCLNTAGVAVTPGRFFGPDGEGHLRLSFAVTDDDLRTGIRGVIAALNAL